LDNNGIKKHLSQESRKEELKLFKRGDSQVQPALVMQLFNI